MRFLLMIFVLFSLPAHAQDVPELSSEYNIIGYVDLVMDGEETRLPIVTMPEQGRSFAKIEELNAEHNINRITIAGITPREDGQWQFPMIEFSVQSNKFPLLQGIFISYALEPFRTDYGFVAGTQFETAKVSDLVMDENGLVEFNFSGQLTHSDRNAETGEFTPQEGVAPVEISGKVSVIIPAEFRT